MNPKSSATISALEWTCPTCNRALTTSFCPTCGEQLLQSRDLTLHGLLGQAAQALTDLDTRLIRSFRDLITRPGTLTVAYLKGQRKPYTQPLQLFLVANVLFFAVQTFIGAKIFSTPLDGHMQTQPWSDWARTLVAHRLQVKATTLEAYAPLFDRAVALNAKSLIVLMVLPFAAVPPIVYRKHLPLVTHVIFSLHFYAFLLILFCAALAVVGVDSSFGGDGLRSETFDHVLSWTEVVACAIYLYFAAGKVYGDTRWMLALKVVPLVLAAAAIVLGYRFAMLLVTLYTT